MRWEYDREASSLYIHLTDQPYSHGRDVDPERRIDYAADGTPIGVELTCVRSGVNVESLPEAQQIAELLHSLDIPVFA